MMLPLPQCGLDITTWWDYSISRYAVALDTSTGEYLTASDGRGKGGRNKFFLKNAEGKTIKQIRAGNLAEAIEIISSH